MEEKRLFGISQTPQTPRQFPQSSNSSLSNQSQQQLGTSSSNNSCAMMGPGPTNSVNNNNGTIASNRASSHHYQQQPPRNVFLKPTDSKPAYNGRGVYQGQFVKHEVCVFEYYTLFFVCT